MDIINDLRNLKETIWLNPELESVEPKFSLNERGYIHVLAAQNRFMRFLPYIASAFPETAAKKGVIESSLYPISAIQQDLNANGIHIPGKLYLKDDAHLPIAGSVKARGGIHAVLKIAETLMQREGKLSPGSNYAVVDSAEFREFFSRFTIQVGSTGNLGLSIGMIASTLGFRTMIHMSRDAAVWKKDLLRSKGCVVKEYAGDYSTAVALGRVESSMNPDSFFVDDENSKDLFFGYASAGMRLKVQLRNLGIPVDKDHPLFVYLPCGVGGAPAGITFGLKQMFGSSVHCFFAEPTQAPSFLLRMVSGQPDVAISSLGLDGKTIADGLAVGRASELAASMMRPLISGCVTVSDKHLLEDCGKAYSLEQIRLEPSACAGFAGLRMINSGLGYGNSYLAHNGLAEKMANATHIVWATGGGLMPECIWEEMIVGELLPVDNCDS